jgi:hypothetical protein
MTAGVFCFWRQVRLVGGRTAEKACGRKNGRKRAMSIKPEDVKRVIEDEDDFGHEMRVGRVLNHMAYEATKDPFNGTDLEPPDHGGTYTDSITSKPRQFDYRCRIIRRTPMQRVTCALLAIECKNLHESAPLVVCGRPRTAGEAYYSFIESHLDDSGRCLSSATRRVETFQLYGAGKFVGKSLVRVREKNGKLETDTNADVYDRWAQAVASSVELAEAARSFANDMWRHFASLVLPVVVVPDGALWRVAYDNKGRIAEAPAAVEECEFFVGRKLKFGRQPFVLTHIHFVTVCGLEVLLDRFWKQRGVWDWIFPARAELVPPEDG